MVYRRWISDASRYQPQIRLMVSDCGGSADVFGVAQRRPVSYACRGSIICGACWDYPVESYLAPSVRSTQSLEIHVRWSAAPRRQPFYSKAMQQRRNFLDYSMVLPFDPSVNRGIAQDTKCDRERVAGAISACRFCQEPVRSLFFVLAHLRERRLNAGGENCTPLDAATKLPT
jgi:hypothetical protein